jgi:ADP-ribosylglycohydrolase
MKNGGTFNTLAGQPTDDTEMALMLARSIVKEKKFDPDRVYKAYQFWLQSKPFDSGGTTRRGLTGTPDNGSQANGSLMRISPLGIYGSRFDLDTVANWAMQDSRLTHPNTVCQKAVAIYTMTIAEAIATGLDKDALYENALQRAKSERYYEKSVYEALQRAADSVPDDFGTNAGWVLLALQNAYYRLLHSKGTEQAIVETVNEGGDTDTNGCIVGALLGAVYGIDSIPDRWRNAVLNCKASKDNPDCKNPRPECFWAVDVLELAEALLTV